MNIPSPARLRRNHILLVTAVLLVALTIYPWLAPLPKPRSAAAPQRSEPAPAIAPLPPIATFAAVFERPLFSPSRRRSATGRPAMPEAGLAPRYRLLGVVNQGGARRALIADGGRAVEITEGAALDGWAVARIEQDRVLLSSPSGQAVLKLSRPSAAPPPATPGR